MEEVNALASKINEHLSWNQARITFLAQFIFALLIKSRSTNLCRVAEEFQGHALTESSYRRIKRFFARYEFSFQVLGQLILRWIPTDKYILCMDRTNWKYGKKVRVSYFFHHVEFHQRETWCSRRTIGGVALYVAATRSVKELVVIVSTEKPKSIITDYRKRWCLETLLGQVLPLNEKESIFNSVLLLLVS